MRTQLKVPCSLLFQHLLENFFSSGELFAFVYPSRYSESVAVEVRAGPDRVTQLLLTVDSGVARDPVLHACQMQYCGITEIFTEISGAILGGRARSVQQDWNLASSL